MRTLRRLLVAAVVVVVVGVAGSAVASAYRGNTTTFSALFNSTIGLYPGSDVEILGVSIGHVTKVEPEGAKVRVTMELDHGQAAAADTAAVVVAPTLVSDRYVQLTKPYTSGRKLADGAVITATAVPAEIDDLYDSLDDLTKQLGPDGANKTGALSRFLSVAADNLQGNGTDINTMINQFGKATGTLADSGDDLFATIGNLEKISSTLEQHDSSVAGVNKQLATVSKYLADDRTDMAAAVRNLSGAMADLQSFIKDNRSKLQTSVTNLQGPTQVLVKEKQALAETVQTIPLALQNFLAAYDAGSNTISGRGDLNELTLWSKDGLTAATSDSAPPTLVPGVTDSTGADQ
ncbi:MCE family protein [Nocardioides sp. DS6]|uniref:MCE family protein n=1 Tax=Nocardioides eburneus TaxID=3231482 RepID=A0ABV3STC4_9ACTN